MSPADARAFWKALMDNASALIADAHLLLNAASFGRARSLTVLAQEVLGKALWVYNTFESSWSIGSTESREIDNLAKHGRDHVQKFLEAMIFGDELASFWGDYSHLDERQSGGSWEDAHVRRKAAAEAAATDANVAKQRGFCVTGRRARCW